MVSALATSIHTNKGNSQHSLYHVFVPKEILIYLQSLQPLLAYRSSSKHNRDLARKARNLPSTMISFFLLQSLAVGISPILNYHMCHWTLVGSSQHHRTAFSKILFKDVRITKNTKGGTLARSRQVRWMGKDPPAFPWATASAKVLRSVSLIFTLQILISVSTLHEVLSDDSLEVFG